MTAGKYKYKTTVSSDSVLVRYWINGECACKSVTVKLPIGTNVPEWLMNL